jgi:hypothetical protein
MFISGYNKMLKMKSHEGNITGAAARVAEFDGIRVFMKSSGSDEYNFPNFRVNYKGSNAVFSIDEPALVNGKLPIDISINILKWAKEHRNDLYKNWESVLKEAV